MSRADLGWLALVAFVLAAMILGGLWLAG